MSAPRAQSQVEQLIRARARVRPHAVWLEFEDRKYAWVEVLSLAQRAANGLLGLGVRPGENVAIMAGNSPAFLWTYFGILLIGAHAVPLNRWQRGVALEHMLVDSGSTAIAFDDDLREIVTGLRPRCPALRHTISLDGAVGPGADTTFERLAAAPDREPEVEVREPSGAVGIMYTSGTTGPPKGTVATRYADFLGPLLEASGVRAGETMYACLPLFHGNALLISAVGSIRLDARLALAPRFSASRFWDDCRRHRAVEVNTLGAMIPILLKQPRRPDDADNPVRTVLSVGCPASCWREFEERFGVRVVEWYGMSDSPGNLINLEGKVGSVGRPAGGAEFRVADAHDRTLPAGKTGQLLFRNPAGRVTHYHNMPEATDAAYRDGWFHSGDLAEMDENGFFYFRGRMKEAIRRRGENISAWEIEAVVDQHPKVRESAAFGVASEMGEEEVMLAIVLQPGADLTPEEVLDFCGGKLAYFTMPRFIEIVESLPKTATQKVQHNVLKARGRSAGTWDRERAGYVVRRD